LPSSQSSSLARTPSPHVLAHALGSSSQPKPVSTAQLALQPSPPLASPSSHASSLATSPSPHVLLHALGSELLSQA
jgi:hypothetical protein